MKSTEIFFSSFWLCIGFYVPSTIVIAGITIHWGLVILFLTGLYLVAKKLGGFLFKKFVTELAKEINKK